MKYTWVEAREQKIWFWISLLFAAFYFGEAFLFWEPQPRFLAPPVVRLAYWGAFGAGIVWLLVRQPKPLRNETVLEVPHAWQSTILGAGITIAVVGMAFLVMCAAGSITLGHTILLAAMFEAGVILGGILGNPGWLTAGIVWATAAALVLRFPSVQDITLGVALVVGFALVGLLRWSVRQPQAANSQS